MDRHLITVEELKDRLRYVLIRLQDSGTISAMTLFRAHAELIAELAEQEEQKPTNQQQAVLTVNFGAPP